MLGAGGSGGGGGAIWTPSGSGKNASDVNNSEDAFNTGTFSTTNLNGKNAPGGATNTNPGESGKNYKSASYYSSHPISGSYNTSGFAKADYTNSNGGAFYITQIGVENTSITGYSVNASFTENFELQNTVISGGSGTINGNEVTDITPTITRANGKISFEFSVKYTLKAAESCLGGYDIKLLESMTLSQVDFDEILDNVEIPLTKGGYKECPQVVEERNETEAGTIHRDITRTDRKHLEISSITVDNDVKAYLDVCACSDELTVKYFSEATETLVEKTMFLDPTSYSADLIVENGINRFYTVSFTLEEF